MDIVALIEAANAVHGLGKHLKLTRFQHVCVWTLLFLVSLIAADLLLFHTAAIAVVISVLVLCHLLALLIIIVEQKNQLEYVASLTSMHSGRCDCIAALDALKRTDTRFMTRHQLNTYGECLVMVVKMLGNPAKAKAILDRIDTGETYRHFMNHAIAFDMGDLVTSQRELNAAEISYGGNDSSLLRAQIILNSGVLSVALADYLTADNQFERAISFIEEANIRNKDLIDTAYYNCVMNKTRLGSSDNGRKAGEALLAEYEQLLDMNNPHDKLSVFNLKLAFLRELKASRDEIDAHVNKGIPDDSFILGFSKTESLHMAVSTARIVWAGGLTPFKTLEYLEDHISDIRMFSPADRLHAFFEINNILTSLPDSFLLEYPKLLAALEHYKGQAKDDLDAYRASLPDEAVQGRCKCLSDYKALIACGLIDVSNPIDAIGHCLEEAVSLTNQASLRPAEIEYRSEHIGHLFANQPVLSATEEETYTLIRENIHSIESYIPSMLKYPGTALTHLWLSWSYGLLGDGKKATQHYASFLKLDVSMEHFTPQIRQQHAQAALMVRTYAFQAAIENAAASITRRAVGEDVCAWITSYPGGSSFSASLLLARFLGLEEAKVLICKRWPDTSKEGAWLHHFWLGFPQFGLELDATLSPYGEPSCDRIAFVCGTHPFATGRIASISLAERIGGVSVPPELVHSAQYQTDEPFRDLLEKTIACYEPEGIPSRDEVRTLLENAFGIVPFPNQQ